ncbi:uncharacterized protein LOC131950898 [Physella acuta]|uniref:uncharacterized protein LOC131950898 n=1 Tax=Physella acuta TaxID=109671 RepID=UPI0027DD81F6|nr:uncharacterized protein LOC131950898 [Physella acuta]
MSFLYVNNYFTMRQFYCFLTNQLAFICVLIYSTQAAGLFGPRQTKVQISDENIKEASGLALSRVHPNVAYTHNDRGDVSRFFAIDLSTGNTVATFYVNNATNTDWEDMAYGPCFDDCRSGTCSADVKPSRYCLYIADIGDNGGHGAADVIYAVQEPASLQDGSVDLVGVLRFNWTEPDAETLLLSPDGRFFIVSKVSGGQAKISQLPATAWNSGSVVDLDESKMATLQINTTSNDPQGGDISPDGKQLLLIAEHNIYYFGVPDGDYIKAFENQPPSAVDTYDRVKDSEGIAWAPDQLGFYIIPEGKNISVYYYPRENDVVVG